MSSETAALSSRATAVVAMAVLVLAACTGPPQQKTAPAPAGAVRVDAPPGTFTAGTTVAVTPGQARGQAGDLVVGPVVQVAASTGEQPAEPVTLRFPAPPNGVKASIAYLDEDSGWWLPVETQVDPKTSELTARVDHFSWWTEIRDTLIAGASGAPVQVQDTASWLEYQGGRLLGNRGAPPSCSGPMPTWVAPPLVVNEDKNAELFACGGTSGRNLALKVVNNRGYPVTVEFTKPYARATTDVPASLGDLVQRLSNPGTPTRVFLTPKGEATVTFAQPEGFAGVVEGHARRDAGTMLTTVAFELAAVAGADLPVGNGRTLGLSTVECVAATGKSVPRTAEGVRSTDAGAVSDAALDLDGCLDDVVQGELGHAPPGSDAAKKLSSAARLLKALKIFDFEQQALDAFVNDATPEADLVDVSFRWRGTGRSGDLTPFVDDWARHSTAFTIRADGTGEVHERTYTPCGTSQDCAFNANLAITANADRSATITYSKVWFDDGTATGQTMQLSSADHQALDPYFPLQGDQLKATVDEFGRLVLSPTGPAAQRLKRDDDADTYCGKATKPDHTFECGA